jgi:hypothetical protein
VLQDQQVLLAQVQRQVQVSAERERSALKVVTELKKEMGELKQILKAFVSGRQGEAMASPSLGTRRGSTGGSGQPQTDTRKSSQGFFARPPSCSVTAATEAALRAGAKTAGGRVGERRADSIPGSSGGEHTDGGTGESDSAQQPGLAGSAQLPQGSVARELNGADAEEATNVRAGMGGEGEGPVSKTGGADGSFSPTGVADILTPGENTPDRPVSKERTAEGSAPEGGAADVNSVPGEGIREGSARGETAEGSAPGPSSDGEQTANNSVGRERTASGGLSSTEVEDVAIGESESDVNEKEFVDEHGSAPKSSRESVQGGADVRERLRPGEGMHTNDAPTVVPQWALNYTIGRGYESVAEYWKEWEYGKPGSPLSLRRMEEL